MKKLLLILIMLCIVHLLRGQEMSVKSFYLAETDLTANTPGTMVYDQNGNVCALIKLETTQKGFTFDVGISGVMSTVEKTGEIWVYVPFGVRRITIKHPQLGVIRDYPLPCAIEKGRTYIMTLVAGTVRTIVEQASTKQFLQIEITPSDAILEINGKIKVVDNGVYNELLPFGKYQYKAYCKNYHDLLGIIEVADPDNTHRLNLRLKPAFGHISILEGNQNDLKGAAVYIDDQYMGVIPLRNIQISSGTHSLRVIKELYEAYNVSFVISDEESLELNPNLTPDFAEVTLVTSEDAGIYVNGDFKGKHTWKGKLVTGSYIFESKQNGHIPTEQSYEISRANNQQTIQLQGPTPIYGSLVISSTPSNATISINGKQVGETPKYISNHVIGEYNVSVELNGYETQTKKINIVEGNETTLSFTLEKKVKKTYTSQTSSSVIAIKVGETLKINIPTDVAFWESESPTKVDVDNDGIVTGLAAGKAILWAHMPDGSLKMFTVTVVPGGILSQKEEVSNNSDEKSTINDQGIRVKVNTTQQLYTSIGSHKIKSWESENPKVATVNAVGVVSGNSRGNTIIWAHLYNGGIKMFRITVY